MENFKKKLTSAILCTAFLTMQAALAAIDTGLGVGNGGAVIDSVSGGFVGVTTGSNSASLEFNGNAIIQEGGFADGRRERKTQKSKLTFLNIRENLFVKFIYA